MKTIPKIILIVLLVNFLNSGCGEIERERSKYKSKNTTNTTGSIDNESINYDEDDILILIDQYGGHPSDPKLPKNILGATDLVLSSTNPRELADIITLGIDLALKEVRNHPRYLFALSRIALELEYYDKGYEWLDISAKNGSAPALAYQGYIQYNEGDINKATHSIKAAKEKGFVEPIMDEIEFELSQKTGNKFEYFNRPDIIKALYDGDINYLKSNKILVSYYIGTLQNTLWETDILFLVNNTDFVLELDPKVSVKLGFPSKKAKEYGFVSATKFLSYISDYFKNKELDMNEISLITEQATQDARRIALLYDSHPDFFAIIYQSVVRFSDEALKFN